MSVPAASRINPQVLSILTHEYAKDTPAYKQLKSALAKGEAEVITACQSYLDALAVCVWDCSAVTFSSAQLVSGRTQTPKIVDIQISHIQTAPRSDFPAKIVPISDKTDANFYFLDPLKRRAFHLIVTPNSKKEVQLNEHRYPPFQENRLDQIVEPWNDSIVFVQNGSFSIHSITLPASSVSQPRPDVSDVKV